jgi:hypothetical protein
VDFAIIAPGLVLLLVIIVAPYFCIRDTVKRLFLLEWCDPEPWPAVHVSPATDLRAEPFSQYTVVLGLPKSSKSDAVRDRPEVRYIDLTSSPPDPGPFATEPPDRDIVVLDHFEHNLADPAARAERLAAIERLLHVPGVSVIIVSRVDPLYCLRALLASREDQRAAAELERWTRALVPFRIVRALNPTGLSGANLFAAIWQACTDDERRALFQLSQSNWANYLQRESLSHLALRRVVMRFGGPFQLFDADFSGYVRRAFGEGGVAAAPTGAGDALGAIRLALVAVAIVFVVTLAFVWGEQTLAYITTGVTAITAASRILASVKGKPAVSGEEARNA